MVPAGCAAGAGPPQGLLELDAPHAEVGLGAGAQVGGPLRAVELEDDPLALAQRAEDRTLERAGGQGVLRPVGVANHGAFPGSRVVRLHDALHWLVPRAFFDDYGLGAYH